MTSGRDLPSGSSEMWSSVGRYFWEIAFCFQWVNWEQPDAFMFTLHSYMLKPSKRFITFLKSSDSLTHWVRDNGKKCASIYQTLSSNCVVILGTVIVANKSNRSKQINVLSSLVIICWAIGIFGPFYWQVTGRRQLPQSYGRFPVHRCELGDRALSGSSCMSQV